MIENTADCTNKPSELALFHQKCKTKTNTTPTQTTSCSRLKSLALSQFRTTPQTRQTWEVQTLQQTLV